eukprot:NODE_1846_length_538_cov_828.834356_g1500_i0.p1 GENE.NODE_1846_length_538_cov_828.834356_g1500_i0~~NODE_1846_length_538_cov_828.834356_g1500_i0.p1  ORF type:complete len:140 (-),score=24.66 NODE_1846_length_538_cov_828.834356_g1500_i0:89-508(-)
MGNLLTVQTPMGARPTNFSEGMGLCLTKEGGEVDAALAAMSRRDKVKASTTEVLAALEETPAVDPDKKLLNIIAFAQRATNIGGKYGLVDKDVFGAEQEWVGDEEMMALVRETKDKLEAKGFPSSLDSAKAMGAPVKDD